MRGWRLIKRPKWPNKRNWMGCALGSIRTPTCYVVVAGALSRKRALHCSLQRNEVASSLLLLLTWIYLMACADNSLSKETKEIHFDFAIWILLKTKKKLIGVWEILNLFGSIIVIKNSIQGEKNEEFFFRWNIDLYNTTKQSYAQVYQQVNMRF